VFFAFFDLLHLIWYNCYTNAGFISISEKVGAYVQTRKGASDSKKHKKSSRTHTTLIRVRTCLHSTARSVGWAIGCTPSFSKYERTTKASTTTS
jgi:hypothetical protein